MNATKKIGRPTKNPKNNQLRIRLSDSELDKLETCANILKLSKSDVIRLGVEKIYLEYKK